MTDPNTRRLLDKIDLLTRANNQQCETIGRYARENAAQERELMALRERVAEQGKTATSAAKIRGKA